MIKARTFVLKMLLLFISIGIAISSFEISSIIRSYKKSEAVYNSIKEIAIVENDTVTDGEDEQSPPFSVDFTVLKEINSNIVGWLYIENTEISYPVIKSEDNSFYLTHLPDKSYSSSGTLFFDSRTQLTDKHLLIYGHNMKNGSMFGMLSHYSSQEYYNAHKNIYLITENTTYKLQIYSAYYTTDSDYTYSVNCENGNALEYSYYAHNKSCIDTDSVFNIEDTIITLSTCAFGVSGYNRFVVQCIVEGS